MASRQQTNVEIVREGYEAFNDGDLERAMERFADDIEWVCPDGARFGGTYRGHEEVMGFFERVTSAIDDLHLDIERVIDGGETVVSVGRIQGTGRETGETIDSPFVHVLDMADGKVTHFQEYTDTAHIEQALGP